LDRKRHPTYLFPEGQCCNDTINALVRFGNEFQSSKVFVIAKFELDKLKAEANRKKIKIIQGEDMLHFDDSTFDQNEKKQFWNKMNNLQKLKRKKMKDGGLWSVNLNGIKCFALVVHSLSPLRKYLARLIEKECIEALRINFLGENVSPTKQIRLENNDQDVTGNEPCIVYPSQEFIGKKVHEIITFKLSKNLPPSETLSFKGVTCILLLPDRKSIENQTKERLLKAMEYYRKRFGFDFQPSIQVARINQLAKEMKSIWTSFIESAIKNTDVLHIIVHDECHWAAGKNQSSYKFLGFENGDYHYDSSGVR